MYIYIIFWTTQYLNYNLPSYLLEIIMLFCCRKI